MGPRGFLFLVGSFDYLYSTDKSPASHPCQWMQPLVVDDDEVPYGLGFGWQLGVETRLDVSSDHQGKLIPETSPLLQRGIAVCELVLKAMDILDKATVRYHLLNQTK